MTMENNKNIKMTFWELLCNFKVEIPIIQRDYAQGRDSASELRDRFLDSLISSIRNERELRLDFIYGDSFNIDGMRAFHPLDGQQRLTTLWLIHWYIAFRINKLPQERNRFRNFRYVIRESSDEFFTFLTDISLDYESGKLCDAIQGQNCFYKKWKQDPTVVSALNMIDCIDKKLADADDLKSNWNVLVEPDCPICFFLLPLKDIGQSDDLYIKMNARGKALSGYENFKADLVKVIRDNGWGEKLEYSKLLDGDWTDIFWRHRLKGTSQIDEIYLAFITRYLANVYICEGKDAAGNKITEKSLQNEPIEWKLYGEASERKTYSYVYTGFEPYRSLITESELKRIKRLFINIKKIDTDTLLPPWKEKNHLQYIPEYNEAGITMLTMKQRLVFHGISCYLRLDGFDNERFNEWMRVVWNIAENINTEGSMEGLFSAMRIMDELGEHSHEINEWLVIDKPLSLDFGRAQVFEEREKARKIKEEGWKEKILNAEKEYNGAIRFLFLDDKSNIDWKDFDTKRKNLSKILTKSGITDEYRKNAWILRSLVSYCTRWTDQLESWSGHYRYIFSYDYDVWRDNILLRFDENNHLSIQMIYASPVHNILMGEPINQRPFLAETYRFRAIAFDTLINTDIISHFNGKKFYVRWYRNNFCLYPSAEGVMLTMKERDYILSSLLDSGKIVLKRGKLYSGTGRKIISGWEVIFEYKGHEYNWYNGENCSHIRAVENGVTDYGNTSGLGFRWENDDTDIEKFVNKIDESIAKKSSKKENATAKP